VHVTTVLVTHDQEEAMELANRVVVMHEGRVEQVGTPQEIYDEPATPFVAGFVGSANVLHGRVVDGQVHLGSIRLPGAEHLAEGAAATAYVRPHDVRLAAHDDPSRIRAVVERTSRLGWLTQLTLRLPDGHILVAHVPQDEVNGTRAGDEVALDLRNARAFLRA
jgi:sulfate transport system ATP-binding protein